MKLTPSGRTALWIGCGGFLGLAVGGLLVNPTRALELSPGWLIMLAIYVGIIIGMTRVKGPSEPRGKPSAVPAVRANTLTPAQALHVQFEFPDVPAGYPPVLGRGEPLQVLVKVRSSGHDVEGGAVQLTATMGDGSADSGAREAASARDRTLTGDGVTGSGGEVEFTLEPEGTGELRLGAEAKSGAREGHGATTVSIVDYDAEIERLFGEFRTYAVGVLGSDAQYDTAREMCDKLRRRADPATASAILELARVYELVAYGQRDADRRLYLALLEQLMVLEEAEFPGTPAVAREV